MDGQLRLTSEEGKGSRFVIQMPFDLPPDGPRDSEGGAANQSAASSFVASPLLSSFPPAQDGELTLVERGGAALSFSHNLTREKSFDDTKSITSQRSTTSKASGKSGLSDADRLIDAIQMPLSLGNSDPQAGTTHRRNASEPRHDQRRVSLGGAKASTRSISPRGRSMAAESLAGASQLEEGEDDHVVPEQYVADSKTPIKPVKIPDEYVDLPGPQQTGQASGVLFEIREADGPASDGSGNWRTPAQPGPLRVLVAEDDPINMKLLRKRLEKAGHTVSHALNGDDCATEYEKRPNAFDVVLMDMQVSVVGSVRGWCFCPPPLRFFFLGSK